MVQELDVHRGREALHRQPLAHLHALTAADLRERPTLVQFPRVDPRHSRRWSEIVRTFAASTDAYNLNEQARPSHLPMG